MLKRLPTYLMSFFPFMICYSRVNLIPHTSGRRISSQNRWQICISHFKIQMFYFVIICEFFLKNGVFFSSVEICHYLEQQKNSIKITFYTVFQPAPAILLLTHLSKSRNLSASKSAWKTPGSLDFTGFTGCHILYDSSSLHKVGISMPCEPGTPLA